MKNGDWFGGAAENDARVESTARSGPTKCFMLVVFITLTYGLASLLGTTATADEWYLNLQKPSFTPPVHIFGPVWAVMYVLVGLAGWGTWLRGNLGLPMQIWFIQLAVNLTWPPVFFVMHQIGLAFLLVGIMIILTVMFIRLTWHVDRLSALAMTPYLAWVSFATLLNGLIWLAN